MRLLVVGVDPWVTSSLKSLHLISETSDHALGIELLELYKHDAVIISELEEKDAQAALTKIKPKATIPVIVVAKENSLAAELLAFRLGADEYVPQHMGAQRLQARLCALVRRFNGHRTSLLKTGNLLIDIQKQLVSVKELTIELTRTEYYILELLALNQGVVFRQMIMDKLYADERDDSLSERVIDTHVKRLNRKLADASDGKKYVHPHYGVGYTLRKSS